VLDEFTTRFLKTKNELKERNQQCELLAIEIDKYKKELLSALEELQKLEENEIELKEGYQLTKTNHALELEKHKALTQELTHLRKEKQERIKEGLFYAQEHASYQLGYQQVMEEYTKNEERAKSLSKKLQIVNKERLKYRHECLENQEQIDKYTLKLNSLQSELEEMRKVVYSSMGEPFK